MDTARDRLWSVQDVADYLGIPPRTLYNWRTRGIGPHARRVGRYLRYQEHEVRAWFIAQDETVR
jgi:DNA-binding transcriptional MerR regulator